MEPRPTVICLCGSTRFKEYFEIINKRLTLEGFIVLSVGFFGHREGLALSDAVKERLETLHLRKIDLADEIFVINPGNYIGEGLRREIQYARDWGKVVRYLVNPEIFEKSRGYN